jgi:hypothetical protein
MQLSPKALGAILLVLLVAGVAYLFFLSRRSVRTATTAESNEPTAKGPAQKWIFTVGVRNPTGAAVGSDGNIYVGSNEGLFAVSPEGKLAWQSLVLSGMHAPPAVAPDGIIYVTTSWGGFESVNPDGTKRWDSRYGMIGFDSSPTVGKGVFYLANTVSDVWAFDPSAATPLVWSLSTARNGMVNNARTLPGSASVNQTRSAASPVLGPDGNLYVPRQQWLHSFGADGTERWRICPTSGSLGQAAAGEDGTIYIGAFDSNYASKLLAVDTDGAIRWKIDVEERVVGSAVVDKLGGVYFCSVDKLTALTPDGQVKWQFSGAGQCSSSPTLTEDGTLYLGAANHLIAVKSDGNLKWSLPTRGSVSWPPVIAADGTIYATTDSGDVIALQDSGSPLMSNAWPRYQHDSQNTGHIVGL